MARIFTVNEAADYLRVTPYTVRKWLRHGTMRGNKIGRRYRIPEVELDAALECGRGPHFTDASALDLEQRFAVLAKQWRTETAIMSSMAMMAMHPAYQRIIGMGKAAVPLILRELSREPDHWFWALCAITGENPVLPEDAGNLQKMTQAWLQLGRSCGWI